MDDVRLTAAERRSLESIEDQLRMDDPALDDLLHAMWEQQSHSRRGLRLPRHRSRPPRTHRPHSGRRWAGVGTRCVLPLVFLALGVGGAAVGTGSVYLVVTAVVLAAAAATAVSVWACVAAVARRSPEAEDNSG